MRLILAGFCLAWSAVTLSAAPGRDSTERYSVVAHGETVGHLVAVHHGSGVDIDYAVSDNGRGPRVRERLVLGAGGVPVEWHIDGTSLMGGAVHEQMHWHEGRESWVSQADHGEERSPAPTLYIGNDASPWARGLYARLAARSPGQVLAVLPRGALHLEHLRHLTVGRGARAVPVEAVLLSGVDLTPELLLVDRAGRLFAELTSPLLVREGYESEQDTLDDLGERLVRERLEALERTAAHRYDVPVRIRHVKVFDPQAGASSGPKAVVFFRGRITTIEADDGRPAPTDEVTVDGGGGTLVAGLHDMHAHNSAWSGVFFLAAGVTTARDMGNDNHMLLDLSARIDAGSLPGPHILPSGFLEGRSPYSARLGMIPETLDEALRDVRWYADRGYLQIKIYNSMNPDWVKPIAAEAARLGLRTVGHVPAFATPDRMLEDGYNEITHVNQLVLGWLLAPGEDTRTPLRLTALARAAALDLGSAPVAHTLALLHQHDAGLDTTVAIVEQLMLSRAGTVAEGAAAYLDHMPVGYQRYRRRSYVNFKDEAEKATYDKAFAHVLDTLALLHREHVPLWPGTDDIIGFTLHRELELYVEAGLTPAEALRVATLDCDRYLGRDQDFGSLERGKHADFLLTAGDPAQDLAALHAIRMVVKDGVIYFPSELYAALGIAPFAAPPTLTPAAPQPPAAATGRTVAPHAFGDDE